MTTTTVAALAELVGGRVVGDASRRIDRIADLRSAGEGDLGFVRDRKYRDAARESRAAALITFEQVETRAVQIVVADVATAFAKVALQFHPLPRAERLDVHATAVVHPAAHLEPPVVISAHAIVGRTRIGAGTIVGAGSVIGDDCALGRDCYLHARVVLGDRVRCGDRVILQSGAVIGSDGFGYARAEGRYLRVPQVGGVVLADDVEIGANCAIDRGAIGDTRIGARTKIDNLCHIAHNCVVGDDCAFAAGALIAGSVVIGNRVTLAGHVIVNGHTRICDDVRVGGNSGVRVDIEKPGDYMGFPLLEKVAFARHHRALRELSTMHEELQALQKRFGGGAADGSAQGTGGGG